MSAFLAVLAVTLLSYAKPHFQTDKIWCVVNYCVAPYLKEMLVKKVKDTLCYVMPFDESLNVKTQECQMDLLVRFSASLKKQIKSHCDFNFIGHSTDLDICDKEKHEWIKAGSGFDGPPSSNWKIYCLLAAYRTDQGLPKFTNIGICPLNILHGMFK